MPQKLKLTPKPDICKACPWWGDGTGFAPDEVNPDASICFMGARPDEQAEVSGVPFTGRTGKMIEANIGKYGLTRTNATWANVTRCRFNHTNEKPASFYDAQLYCGQAFRRPVMGQYKVVVPLDDEALLLCAGLNDVEVWRGSPIIPDSGLAVGGLVLPTPHPSIIFSKPRLRSASKSDFGRVYRAVAGGAKEFKYNDEFQCACNPDAFVEKFRELSGSDRLVSLDVETNHAKPVDAKLRIFGIGWGKDRAANVEWEALSDDQAKRLRVCVSNAKCKFITATPFDYTVLSRLGFAFPWGACHDLTLLHSRYDIELPHTVAFIASTWTYRKFWKWLSDSEPYYYNCLDCAAEWEAFTKLYDYLKAKEPEILVCYERDRRQIRTAVHTHLAGMPLNRDQFKIERKTYGELRDSLEAELTTEFTKDKPPLEVPPQCEKHKRYSGRTELKLRKGESEVCSVCLAMRQSFRSSRPLNLRSHQEMRKLLESEGKKVPYSRKWKRVSMDKAAIKGMATKYQDQRLFRLLEFRAHDKVMSSYFKEAKVSPSTGRVHSTYSMHSAMHRWHCTEPNQQQVKRPELINGELHGPRRAYVTGPGRTFLAFDADGLHYRIAGTLSGDPFINDTLARYDREGKPEYKPHIVNTCALFKVDTAQALEWMKHEAPQYTFSKNFIYMLLNGGDTPALAQAAVAAKLDLNMKQVDTLKNNWLTKAHYFREWRERLVREAEKTGTVTLFDGRRRRYYGMRWKDGKWLAGPNELKEVYNHPLIGTEVSYVNPRLEKVMDFVEANQEWQLVLLSHDGFMLEGPEAEAYPTARRLLPTLTQPFQCGQGKTLRVPWSAKTGQCWALLESVSVVGG